MKKILILVSLLLLPPFVVGEMQEFDIKDDILSTAYSNNKLYLKVGYGESNVYQLSNDGALKLDLIDCKLDEEEDRLLVVEDSIYKINEKEYKLKLVEKGKNGFGEEIRLIDKKQANALLKKKKIKGDAWLDPCLGSYYSNKELVSAMFDNDENCYIANYNIETKKSELVDLNDKTARVLHAENGKSLILNGKNEVLLIDWADKSIKVHSKLPKEASCVAYADENFYYLDKGCKKLIKQDKAGKTEEIFADLPGLSYLYAHIIGDSYVVTAVTKENKNKIISIDLK